MMMITLKKIELLDSDKMRVDSNKKIRSVNWCTLVQEINMNIRWAIKNTKSLMMLKLRNNGVSLRKAEYVWTMWTPEKVLSVKKNFELFVGKKSNKVVTPLCVLLLKISGYLRNSDYAKNISFLVKEKKYCWNTKKKLKRITGERNW